MGVFALLVEIRVLTMADDRKLAHQQTERSIITVVVVCLLIDVIVVVVVSITW